MVAATLGAVWLLMMGRCMYTAIFPSSSPLSSSSNGNSKDKNNKVTNGKPIAFAIRHEIQQKVQQLQETRNITLGLAILLVGTHCDSQTYVNMKKKGVCTSRDLVGGIWLWWHVVTWWTDSNHLHALELNANNNIHGEYWCNCHYPCIFDQDVAVLETIHPTKDMDGLYSFNIAANTL